VNKDLVLSIEPARTFPSRFHLLLPEELGKHLFRWYIEDEIPFDQLADQMNITLGDLDIYFTKFGITKKSEFVPTPRGQRLYLYYQKAMLTQSRTTCLKRGVAAVLINIRNRDVLYSFNGAPKGDLHCTDIGTCKKDIYGYGSGEGYEVCVALHAEQSLIAEAAAAGISTENETILITAQPCEICFRLIRAARFRMIICPDPNNQGHLIGHHLQSNKFYSEPELLEMY